MNEPTPEQCNKRTRLPDIEGRAAFACWYPQMGGYGSKCVIVVDVREDDPPDTNEKDFAPCFEAFVWHDGEFPFGEESSPDRSPARIHHCRASQFVTFGNDVEAMIRKAKR